MPADAGEKTEAPTAKRRQEAREKGQVGKSADLSAAVGLMAGLTLLDIYGRSFLDKFMDIMRRSFALDQVALAESSILDEAWRLGLHHCWAMLAPFFIVLLVVAIVINLLQVGFVLSAGPITPSLEKISPLSGFKRLFSSRTAVRLIMSLAKVGIIATIAYYTIKSYLPGLLGLSGLTFSEVVGRGASLVFSLGMRMASVLLLLALLDLAYQKWQTWKDQKMTKQELREELKRMEGDPIMRQRRRAVARQLAAQRMSQAVPQADVVITNPTHLAIALKYDHASMPAPKVVARGAGYIAQRIRTLAIEHGVPVVERKPLAQAVYKACEVGDYVPPALYQAVAEVLAYVFELAGKGYRQTAAG